MKKIRKPINYDFHSLILKKECRRKRCKKQFRGFKTYKKIETLTWEQYQNNEYGDFIKVGSIYVIQIIWHHKQTVRTKFGQILKRFKTVQRRGRILAIRV